MQFFTHIGVACIHIATILNEISAHFWLAMHWKSYDFYYSRQVASDDINNMCENLVFASKAPGTCWDNIPSCEKLLSYHKMMLRHHTSQTHYNHNGQ